VPTHRSEAYIADLHRLTEEVRNDESRSAYRAFRGLLPGSRPDLQEAVSDDELPEVGQTPAAKPVISDDVFQALLGLIKAIPAHVCSLDLSYNNLVELDPKQFSELIAALPPSITDLRIDDSDLTSAHWQAAYPALRASNIRRLNIHPSSKNVDEKTRRELSDLYAIPVKNPWLRVETLRTELNPIVMIVNALRFVINRAVGSRLLPIVLPASGDKRMKVPFTPPPARETPVSFDNLKIKTWDGALLDTVQITPDSQQDVPMNERHFVITLPGNGMSYTDYYAQMMDDIDALACTMIGFNYRSVGNSSGQVRSKNDLVVDGIAQVQRLIDAGADPEKIVLSGHSLGGAVATLVAQYFHEQGDRVSLFNDRSFSSITNVATGFVRGSMKNEERKDHIATKILGALAWPLIKLALVASKWEISAGTAWRSIPAEYKTYLVAHDDAAITKFGGLHRDAFIKLDRRLDADEKKANAERKMAKVNSETNENAHVADRKYMAAAAPSEEAAPKRGNSIFQDFVRKTMARSANGAAEQAKHCSYGNMHHRGIADLTGEVQTTVPEQGMPPVERPTLADANKTSAFTYDPDDEDDDQTPASNAGNKR